METRSKRIKHPRQVFLSANVIHNLSPMHANNSVYQRRLGGHSSRASHGMTITVYRQKAGPKGGTFDGRSSLLVYRVLNAFFPLYQVRRGM